MTKALRFEQVVTAEHPDKTAKPGLDGTTPAESAAPLWESAAGDIMVGTWECTPGSFNTKREGFDEIIYILEGSGRLVSDDGEVTAYAAGDVVVIQDGFRGQWHVDETIRKVYFGTTR